MDHYLPVLPQVKITSLVCQRLYWFGLTSVMNWWSIIGNWPTMPLPSSSFEFPEEFPDINGPNPKSPVSLFRWSAEFWIFRRFGYIILRISSINHATCYTIHSLVVRWSPSRILLLSSWQRYSWGILTLYIRGYPLFCVVYLLIFPLSVKQAT